MLFLLSLFFVFCFLYFPSVMSLPYRKFGCSIYFFYYNLNSSKLDLRTLKCVLIDYPPNIKGYKCYQNHRVYITMDITFHKT